MIARIDATSPAPHTQLLATSAAAPDVQRAMDFGRNTRLDAWAHQHGVLLELSPPWKPVGNTFIAACNGRLCSECLNQHRFLSLTDVQRMIGR